MYVLTLLAVMIAAPAEEKKPEDIHERPVIVEMHKENNRLRETVGLEPQKLSPELCRAAQDHADYMARTHDFSHYSNGGLGGRAARHGYKSGSLAENIAMSGSVLGAFYEWRTSGGHWGNITSGHPDSGFGASGSYWVSMYGGASFYTGTYTTGRRQRRSQLSTGRRRGRRR